MGGSGDLDFLSQIPIQIILAPIIFGVLYIVAMYFIFKRAAARRRKARDAKNAALGLAPENTSDAAITGASEATAAPASRSRLERLAGAATSSSNGGNLPEPDLDMLLMPSLDMPAATHAATHIAPMLDPESGVEPVTLEDHAPLAMEEEDMAPESTPSPSPDTADAVEVMRIFRDLSDGALIIRIGDRTLRGADEFQNPELMRRFTTIVRDLTALANSLSGLPESPVTPAGPRETNALPPVAQAMASAGVPGSLKVRTGVESEPIKPGGLFRRVPKPGEPVETVRGVAEAVEEFLQFKLAADPKYMTRNIHIRQAHDGGLRIEVDGHYYTAIGDVVDPDVRELLLAVMKEWEARQ
jgi:hypothetical protein